MLPIYTVYLCIYIKYLIKHYGRSAFIVYHLVQVWEWSKCSIQSRSIQDHPFQSPEVYWHPRVWLKLDHNLSQSLCSSLSQWTSLCHRSQLSNHPVVWFGTNNIKGNALSEHSSEQTTPVFASNLQCSILIVPKWYQRGTCFPLSDGSATINFELGHAFAITALSQNIQISLGKEVPIFSATSNRLEIKSPSTFLTAS